MKAAKEWVDDNRASHHMGTLHPELVQGIQADALNDALDVIEETTNDGLPLEAALALIRIKSCNLTERSHVSPVSDNPKEDAFYEKVEASITHK